MEEIYLEFFKSLNKGKNTDKKALERLKRKFSKDFKVPFFTNAELLRAYHKFLKAGILKKFQYIENALRRKPIRSLSGIVNVSVLTKPYPCPGKCIYCPSQKKVPKSYIKEEPAVQRAILCGFDPFAQTQLRIQALYNNGHPIDKIELRIIGGTWSYYLLKYRRWFIKECFRGANEFVSRSHSERSEESRCHAESTGSFACRRGRLRMTLKKQQKRNEKAKCRIIGIGIETRPDFINTDEIKLLREFGVTKVELGVQSIYNDVLRLNQRGHEIKATIHATKMLKNAGFKVSYQLMPNLAGSSFKKDIQMFEELFSNPDFKPDFIKIYPLALMRETPLYKLYKHGRFKPYSKSQLQKLLIQIKKQIPYWCRVERIIRDIPKEYIVRGGAKISNMRDLIRDDAEFECKCIRCREIREHYKSGEKIYFFREDYEASGGKEIFLSFENKKRTKLFSLLRLRIPTYALLSLRGGANVVSKRRRGLREALPVLKNSAIIREIHTYGQMISIGKKSSASQHKGMGKKLMKKAENIAKREFGLEKMAVISGVGVRDYYRKMGYRLRGSYMVKKI